MAAKREPWDDDSDSDFQSAASFDLDDSEDEARGGRAPDDDDACTPDQPQAFADDDFHECVDGFLLDEGYFGEDAYRGPPGAFAVASVKAAVADRIAEADLERAADTFADASVADVARVCSPSAEIVRDAMARAAAEAVLRGAATGDDDVDVCLSADQILRAPRDTGAPAPPSDREAMLLAPKDSTKDSNDERTPFRRSSDDAFAEPPRGHRSRGASDDEVRSSGSSSDEDLARARALDAWEEDTGAARARRSARRRVAARIAADEVFSSDDDAEETRRREARERRLRLLEAEVLESEARARFDAAALAAVDVAPSDREVLIAESRRELGREPPRATGANSTPRTSPRHDAAAGTESRTKPTTPRLGDAASVLPRGGGGGGGASPRDGACSSGTFNGDFAVAHEREFAHEDRSPRTTRGWRARSTGEDAERAWRDAVPGIALPANPKRKKALPSPSGKKSGEKVVEKGELSPDVSRVSNPLREPLREHRLGRGSGETTPTPTDIDASIRTSGSSAASAAETSPGRVAALRRQFEARAEKADAARADAARADAATERADPPEPRGPETSDDDSSARVVGARFPEETPFSSTRGFAPRAPSSAETTETTETPRPVSAVGGSRPRHRAAGALGPRSRRGAAALAADPDARKFPLHAAAFYGDLDALRAEIFAATRTEEKNATETTETADFRTSDGVGSPLIALDACGNTAAHVAVLRGDARALALLLDDAACDFPVDARSASGWTLTQEAARARDARLVRLLVAKSAERASRDSKRETAKLVAALRDVPDMTMQMRWAFGSAVFGPVLRAYAPSDTYDIAKRGGSVRVDGTLRGADEDRNALGEPKSVLPKWKRGAFSMLFVAGEEEPKGEEQRREERPFASGGDARDPKTLGSEKGSEKAVEDTMIKTNRGSALWYLDHEKREAVDMSDADTTEGDRLDGFSRDELIDAETNALLARDGSIAKEKYEASDVTFKPVKAWLGGDRVESVGPWRASVWEACGFVSKRRVTRSGAFFVTGTFGEYLASSREGAKDLVERRDASVEAVAAGEEEDENDSGDENARSAEDADEDEAPALSPSGGNVGGSVHESNANAKTAKTVSTVETRPLTSREARRRRRRERSEKAVPKPRRVTARCWIARGFPLRVEDVSPILDIASRANKHLKKAKRVVEYWRGAHAGTFPVKVTVPIMMTVYATIDFRNFRAAAETSGDAEEDADAGGDGGERARRKKAGRRTGGTGSRAPSEKPTPNDRAYFEVPPGYARKTLVQALREAEEEERRQLEAEARARKAARDEAQRLKQLKK